MLGRPGCTHPWLMFLPIVLTLAACAPPAGRIDDAFSPYMDGAEVIVPERSIVALPSGLDDPLAVRREVRDSMLFERVVLANDTALRGENAINVRTRFRGTPYARFFSGPLRNPFTETAIGERIAAEFDGLDTVTRPIDRINRRGPYRYVIASDDGGSACVLAWQLVDRAAEVSGQTSTYAVDLRYCSRTGDPERLVAFFDGLEIEPYL